MAENDTPHSKPDLAEGSMAFMPTPDGVKPPEGEIILKHDKHAEKTSITEFTDHIAGAETEKSSKDGAKAVPVRLGGGEKDSSEAKHVPENSDSPIKLAKSKTAKPLIEASVAEEPAHDPENQAINHMPEPDPSYDEYRKTRSKSVPVLIVILLITLIGAGFLGWQWWAGRTQITTLTKKVSDLESSNASLDKRLKVATGESATDDSAASGAGSDANRTIPELGLSYEITDTTKLLTYRYRESVDAQAKVHSVLSLSSTAVIAAERKVNTTGAPKCTAEFGPLGLLTSYKASDLYKGARVDTLTADKEKTFKIGDLYYIYETSQTPCSTNAEVVTAVTSGKAAVTTMLQSLSN